MLDWITVRQENNDFYFWYEPYSPVNVLPLQASIDTVKYIQKKYPPPYTLMLSGGVDSQAMLYAWIQSGVPFNTFSGKYNHDYNAEDLVNLDLFAKRYNVDINYVDIDVLGFLHNEYFEYVHKYRCGSPPMLVYIKMIEMITEGTSIMSGNFCTTIQTGRDMVDKNNFVIYRYGLQTKKPIVPFFFIETKELYYSFYRPGQTKDLTGNQDPTDLQTIYATKVATYQKHGFPVIPQLRKMTGFEKIKDYYDIHYKHLVTPQDRLLRLRNQNSRRTFDLLLRNKYEVKFSTDKYEYRVFHE